MHRIQSAVASNHAGVARERVWCLTCPLRQIPALHGVSDADATTLEEFKQGQRFAEAGSVILERGARPGLFTLFSGWAAEYRALGSGERQLVAILLPGDLIGLDTVMAGPSESTIIAVTPVMLCSFVPTRVDEMFRHESFMRSITRAAVAGRRRLVDSLTALGAGRTSRALAHFVVTLHDRLQIRGLMHDGGFKTPLGKRHLAEACGVTGVHLHRVMQFLQAERVMSFAAGQFSIYDMERLRRMAGLSVNGAEAETVL